jgi:predicted transcriptional regulator
MDKPLKTEVEEVVLQALGHEERRNILKIIGASSEGVTYSSILGETGLDTGHLNYHMRGLEGLIEKDDDRIYQLTPLGLKALRLLKGIDDDVNGDVSKYIKSAKSSQRSLLHPLVKLVLLVFTIGAGIVFLGSIILLVNVHGAQNATILALFTGSISGVTLYYLLKSFRTVPKFVRKWEKKILEKR